MTVGGEPKIDRFFFSIAEGGGIDSWLAHVLDSTRYYQISGFLNIKFDRIDSVLSERLMLIGFQGRSA